MRIGRPGPRSLSVLPSRKTLSNTVVWLRHCRMTPEAVISVAPYMLNASPPPLPSDRSRFPLVASSNLTCRRAMLTLPPEEEPHTSKGSFEDDDSGGGDGGSCSPAATRVGGVAIATCCHHACNWRDYAGRDFLAQQVRCSKMAMLRGRVRRCPVR